MTLFLTRRELLSAVVGAAAAPPLFDGRTFAGFRTPTQQTGPEVSWTIRDGELHTIADARRQCDLWTAAEFTSFDLQFEWWLAPGANSGIKYLIQATVVDKLKDAQGEFLHETSLGFEFQLVDDNSGAGAGNPTHPSGALYNYLAPTERAAHPAGQWNTARLLLDGDTVEHWVNGRMVLRFGLQSPELKAALAVRKVNSARMLERLDKRRSPVAFQHHESHAAFRSIRLREL